VSFAAISLCVASQSVIIIIIIIIIIIDFIMTQSGNFWIHSPTFRLLKDFTGSCNVSIFGILFMIV
jgi:hypothetical protein